MAEVKAGDREKASKVYTGLVFALCQTEDDDATCEAVIALAIAEAREAGFAAGAASAFDEASAVLRRRISAHGHSGLSHHDTAIVAECADILKAEAATIRARGAAECLASKPTYPCAECGKPRTKAEGGTVFTVCDDCWDVPVVAEPPRGQ